MSCLIHQTGVIKNYLQTDHGFENSKRILLELVSLWKKAVLTPKRENRLCPGQKNNETVDYPKGIVKYFSFHYNKERYSLVLVSEDYSQYRPLRDYIYLAEANDEIHKLTNVQIHIVLVKILEAFIEIRKF